MIAVAPCCRLRRSSGAERVRRPLAAPLGDPSCCGCRRRGPSARSACGARTTVRRHPRRDLRAPARGDSRRDADGRRWRMLLDRLAADARQRGRALTCTPSCWRRCLRPREAGRARRWRHACVPLRDAAATGPPRAGTRGRRAAAARGVDAILAVDERSFWVVGWCRDEDGTLDHAEIVISPEGQRAQLLDGAYRYRAARRRGVHGRDRHHTTRKHGFVKLIELPAPSLLTDGWVIELRTHGRQRATDRRRRPVASEIRSRPAQTILGEFTTERADIDRLRTRSRAIRRSRASRRTLERADRRSRTTSSTGEPPAEPEVSIIVPLYGRIDFVEHQLAQFWQDPEIGAAELIYVLDSPELAPSRSSTFAAALHELYGVPFQVMTLNRNARLRRGEQPRRVQRARAPGAAAQLRRAARSSRAGWAGWRSSTTPRRTSARSAPSCSTRTTRSSTPACTSSASPAPASGRTSTTSRASAARCPPRT